MDEKKMRERIALMLAKAESTTPEEAEMIMAQVEKMLFKLGLDSLAEFATDRTSDKIIEKSMTFTGQYSYTWCQFVHSVSQAMPGIRAYAVTRRDARTMFIVGYERDVERLNLILTSLQVQAVTAMNHRAKTDCAYVLAGAGTYRLNWRKDFLLGFAYGARERMTASHSVVVAENPTIAGVSTDLVLIDRGHEVDDYLSKYNLTKSKSTRRGYVGQAYDAGIQDGRVARTGETEVDRRTAIGQ